MWLSVDESPFSKWSVLPTAGATSAWVDGLDRSQLSVDLSGLHIGSLGVK